MFTLHLSQDITINIAAWHAWHAVPGVDPKRDKPALVDDYCKALVTAPTLGVHIVTDIVTCGGIEKGMQYYAVWVLVALCRVAAVAGTAKREDFHPRIVGLTGTPEQVKKAGESSRKLAKWTKHADRI